MAILPRVLACLEQHGPMSLHQVCEHLTDCKPKSVSVTLSKASKHGLIVLSNRRTWGLPAQFDEGFASSDKGVLLYVPNDKDRYRQVERTLSEFKDCKGVAGYSAHRLTKMQRATTMRNIRALQALLPGMDPTTAKRARTTIENLRQQLGRAE